jgi:hypothetical protein
MQVQSPGAPTLQSGYEITFKAVVLMTNLPPKVASLEEVVRLYGWRHWV